MRVLCFHQFLKGDSKKLKPNSRETTVLLKNYKQIHSGQMFFTVLSCVKKNPFPTANCGSEILRLTCAMPHS